MPSYSYDAMNGDGEVVRGNISAAGRSEAIAALAADGVFVTDIHDAAIAKAEAPRPAPRALSTVRRTGRRLRPRAKAALLRQLATALGAGLPLVSALSTVGEQAENTAMRDATVALAQRVQAGESLSDAMTAADMNFTPLEASMARVGETAGVLDEVMGYLADFAERDLDVREKIRSAAMYPIFVLSLAAVSVVVVMTAILPRVVATVVEGVGEVALPAPTRILMAICDALVSYGWLMGIGAVVAAVAFRAWLASPSGRLKFDTFKLRIPVLGTAVRRVAVGRFTRTLGTLSKSGIGILEAFQVLRDTLGNEALARSVDRVAADITQGRSIAEPLRQSGQFPPLLTQVIAMGERTGKLDELLLRTADAYEKETAAAIQRVTTLLPAVLIVLLALVVVFILAAVLLPIINMETSVPGM